MASTKGASRYALSDSRSSLSPQQSSSSFSDLNSTSKLGHNLGGNTCRTLARTRSSGLPSMVPEKSKHEQNFTSLVKKFMDRKSKPKDTPLAALVIPEDSVAKGLKKTAVNGSKVSSFGRKFFHKASDPDQKKPKALTAGKENVRSLAMVLKSEKDLMSRNKEYETELEELRVHLAEKNSEMEKLKDLCLRQREEIRALKSSILYPEVSTFQLQKAVDKQGFELEHANKVIPKLQEQVSTLTSQLKHLAEGLAEVKADKSTSQTFSDSNFSWPKTPLYDQEAVNSFEVSSGTSGGTTTPGSPDDMIFKDMNPCLTPKYSKEKSQEYCDLMSGLAIPDILEEKENMNLKQYMDIDKYSASYKNQNSCMASPTLGKPNRYEGYAGKTAILKQKSDKFKGRSGKQNIL